MCVSPSDWRQRNGQEYFGSEIRRDEKESIGTWCVDEQRRTMWQSNFQQLHKYASVVKCKKLCQSEDSIEIELGNRK